MERKSQCQFYGIRFLARHAFRAAHLSERSSIIVVEPALHDQKAVILDPIDEAVLLCDPSGPPAFQIVPEWLWLANSREWVP